MDTQNNSGNLFDRFIDEFSVKDLETRVWFVVIAGFALCAIAIFAGYVLLTHEFFVADEPGLDKVKLIRLLLGK